uniref:Cullin 7 n=1 Tax=Oncorhynchus tshawytscha TaxID=74940 RepID=A0A8C8BSN0_ONCTS
MVGERRNGNLLVQLGTKLQAYPEELIRQRRTHDGQTEYLIRWCLLAIDDGSGSGESKTENILMWMSTEDVYANCPTLLGKRKADTQRPLQEEERPSGEFPADVTFDEVELSDMKDDVKNLVTRARKQMAKKSDFAISITHTIHVLSAYASIGSLVGVFKETGALDLLMELLCNKERQTRRSAGKMLRALASHDAGSRAYVLLSLSQQDGIEQHMDFDNRYTLLELFAETTSSEEHGISFEGIHLPQVIPGKLLFSLVKRYLCVTSLMDKLNTAGVESSSERQDSAGSSSGTGHQPENLRVQREFEFTMAMANLISELVRVMGWDRNRQPPQSAGLVQGSACGEDREDEPPRRTSNGFKTRTDFASRSAYVEYVQENLKSGMLVRMLEDYEEVSAGDEGDFRYSNDGSPPVQVYWTSLSRTYWVHWHMVEILGTGTSGQGEKDAQEKASSLTETIKLTTVSQTLFSKPPGGLYSLPYLAEGLQSDGATLSRAEWWEVLFFIKKLEPKQQQEINNILRQSLDEQANEATLIQLSVPGEVARKMLHYLKQTLQNSCLWDLLCSHAFSKHYLRRGGGGLEDDELLPDGSLGSSGLGGGRGNSSSDATATASSSSAMGSLSKKDKVLKLLVEILSGQPKENVVSTLRLTRALMVKYEWRVSFATEGGVKAILSCMQEYPTVPQVQQVALAVSSQSLFLFFNSRFISGTPMMLGVFASIGSATAEGSKGLLAAIPAGIELMLNTPRYVFYTPTEHLYILSCRILNKFLDNYLEDLLPWHESIEPCLSSMTAFINDREVVQLLIRFLYRLASVNKDYAVVMCRLGTKDALGKALDKHSINLLLVTELRDLITDCEKYASLYKKMTTSVLAGCIQMVLGQIEEHRRSHQPINIPFFDIFLRNLCQGSSVELKEDKCWEKVEVSSNHHRANKLTDKNPKTYWESNGCTGSHFINIYMHKGVVIRQLAVLVASEDSSYMPARMVVLGGDDPTNINTELNTVNVPPSANRIVLLENMTRFWSIVQIRIKRCQQGGIDTRVHGFEVLGPKPTFWPVFKEQLCCRTYLFYTTKAHTWCQEILEDKAQLLQLFNKLNSALRHEQMFADRFLPDAEAAEALGRTCWEALITPIVQSITISETQVLSPLSWLLSEYLDNAESARRCKSRAAIFNSRVRRLTHLLVHVDTSRVDTEELKPPIKCSDSIAGIALCWQGVVQRQVKKFLDSTCSLPDFVERYRNMYLRLKNAMEELFGQQTAFVLALRHGFSAALLQLSILTAMHVSERFAQYIDLMIQESGVDSGNVETLNQLQQFLEPMLFLSGLELANTFEHFYRYYLGDRLLGQGKVWLESAVIMQIGTCFPNRFPQQMLKNLSESEELQQEFHLYRLQQLDKTLQDVDEEMMDDQPSEPEEESEVKVLILSPRCWAVSSPCYMDNHSRYFPKQLCTYLAEFTDFYSNSQSHSVISFQKPRRLQWTWLGHAELRYGTCTLYVSTLQMYILLQFNHQDVSVEALQQATGLSPTMLAHALSPLTAGKGILTQDRVLRLNKKALSQSLESHSYCYLLPKQTYLNVDEDAARSLERKRNFIYCLIIQIMKAEKEMHIDNLVFRVLDTCQKREVTRSPGSVRFSCSTTDVLSCVMHVISKGYIRRNEDSPHIVEFLPEDPSTPQKGQAHFSFSKAELKNNPSKDGVLEAVLLSMGRTMNQEEVRQLMQRTVQQVSGTLSLDLDRAEHLLVHCKWNMDVLIQRYTDDPDSLVLAAGLKGLNPQPPPSPVASCPVCLISQTGEAEPAPTLCCMHYCCRSCWQEYLTARIEQNLVMNCNCPITDCRAQPTSQFFFNILTDKDTIAKYENALLRGYVECCSNLTWCTNPLGCDQILCKENIGSMGTCSKCCWSSCFSCNFPEAHYPASCSHMSQWMDDGGYYEGMTMEAQSKHLAKLISKRCPSCQAQIEKNEGCLHMTCAKCNHGFCWRCLKPWKPTHKDYYNCSAMVSKAARQEKKFQDYNERCTFHNQAKDFAINLESKVSSINEALQMKSLTFVIDACKVLAQARKVLAYSCVYSYYNQDTEKMDVMEQQMEALELHTNALQILLEETLLQCTDLASCVRLLKPEHLNTGLELIRRIQERLVAILQHSTQVGTCTHTHSEEQNTKCGANTYWMHCGPINSGDEAEEDDEYDDEEVLEWHEDDEDDIDEDDFFSDDDEKEMSICAGTANTI